MKKRRPSFTLSISLSDNNFGNIYLSSALLSLIDPVLHPYMEFVGDEGDSVWTILLHEVKPNVPMGTVSTTAKKTKGRKLIYKMLDLLDVESDLNKFNIELNIINGKPAIVFDITANINPGPPVVLAASELYDPKSITSRREKTQGNSPYAPVGLSKGYYVSY